MSLDLPGFADPVREAQSGFRLVLEAMSRPGHIITLGETLTPPASLGRAAAAVLLTLLDGDTSLCLAEEAPAIREWLAFHTGTAFASMGSARFVWARALSDLATLDDGTDEAPQDSATLILELAALGSGRTLRLTGPGLPRTTSFAVDGLPADFVACWAENHARFPRGIDLILCAGTALAALPRSIAIAEG